MNDKMIEEMAKLDIEESAGFYSAFINDMRISKNKPLSISKTVMSFDCPKKYILQAIGIPEGSVVLSKEELNDLEYKAYSRGVCFACEKVDEQKEKARKETAKEILKKGEEFYKMSYHKSNAIHRLAEWIKDTFGVEVEE